MKKNEWIGLLLILAATSTLFIIALPGAKVQINIDKTKSVFYVNHTGTLDMAGQEQVYIYNGSKSVSATIREPLQSYQEGDMVYLIRRTHFGPVLAIETYKWDSTKANVESFPISHEINVVNGSGYTLQYVVSKLTYEGVSRNAVSAERFGKNMNVEWDNGAFYQKISKTTTGTKLTIKYKVNSNDATYNVRLFDPITPDDIFNNLIDNLPSGQATFNVTVPGSVNINVSLLQLSYNEICGHVTSTQVLLGQIVINGSNTSYQYIPTDIIGKGKQSIRIVANIQDGSCDNGTSIGHKIDWIPCINYSGTMYCQNKWAWWNSTSPIEFGGQQFPNYWSQLDNGSSTTYIKPIYPYQNFLIAVYGGENTTNDEIGRYNGVPTSVTYSNGKIGNSYNLSNTGYITISNFQPNFSNGFTLSVWLYRTGCTNGMRAIEKGGNQDFGLIFQTADCSQLFWTSGTGTGSFTINGASTLNTWQNYFIVWNTTHTMIYINGVLNTTYANSTPMSTISSTLNIGRYGGGAGYNYVGLEDELKIWNNAQTSSDALAEYNNGTGRKYQQVNLQQNFEYAPYIISVWKGENNSLDEKYKYSFNQYGHSYTNGVNGNALYFNQAIKTVSNNTNFQGLNVSTQDFFIDFFINISTINTTDQSYILCNMVTSSVARAFCVNTETSGKLSFSTYDGTTTVTSQSPSALNAGQVYRITLINNKTAFQMWINGSLVNTSTVPAGFKSTINTQGFSMGSYYNPSAATNVYFNGWVDELVIGNTSNINATLMYNSGSIYNSSANMFYSTKNTLLSNYSNFNMTLNASNNNALVKLSANNGTNWTKWYNMTSNGLSLPFDVAGNILMFQINLSNGNATYSPVVYGFGIVNATFTSSQNISVNVSNLTIQGFQKNINVELKSVLNVSSYLNMTGVSNSTLICVDVNHDNYGVNYSCGYNQTNFLLNITDFKLDTFMDGSYNESMMIVKSNLCFQESANISNQVGTDGNCDLNYSGKYDFGNISLWFAPNNLIDGYYLSYSSISANTTAILYVNYSFPASSLNVLPNLNKSYITYYEDSASNPFGVYHNRGLNYCGNNNPVRIRYTFSRGVDALSNFYELNSSCYNGSQWIILGSNSDYLMYFYEESITWGFDNSFSIQSNKFDEVINLSMNLTGGTINNSFPKDVYVYLGNKQVYYLPSILNSTFNNPNYFSDGSIFKNVSYISASTLNVANLSLPKTAVFTSNLSFNLTGNKFNEICYQGDSLTENDCGGLPNGQSFANSNYIYKTYAKPLFAKNSSVLQAKYGVNLTNNESFFLNLTIPPTCWNLNKDWIYFRFYSYTAFDNSTGYFQCNNGSWITFSPYSLGPHTSVSAGSDQNYYYALDGNYSTSASYYGPNIWPINLNDTHDGGTYSRLFDFGMYWNMTQNYPNETWIEVGNIDGIREWNYSGKLNFSTTINISSNLIASYLNNCQNSCPVPIYIYSGSNGIVYLNNLNISYNYLINPIIINPNDIQDYYSSTNSSMINLTFISNNSGAIYIDDLKYKYRGGNKTYKVLAHNADYSSNLSYNVTFFYSRFMKNLPYTWSNITFFQPKSYNQSNVSAYGQSNNIPIYNITGLSYGEFLGFLLYVNVNETYSCLNLTMSESNNKSQGTILSTNYAHISNILMNGTQSLWLWADLDMCNSSVKRYLQPQIKFKSCCLGCEVCEP